MSVPISVKSGAERSRRWPLVAGGALLLLLLVIGTLYWRASRALNDELQAAIAETDRVDPGWRIEDLDGARTAIPDERNGALCVLASARLLPRGWPLNVRPATAPPGDESEPPRSLDEILGDVAPEQQLTEAQTRELRAQLEKVGPALAEARGLIDMPDGRYPIHWKVDYLTTSIDEAQQSRKVASLLHYGAMLQAQDNDLEAACHSERALGHLCRSFDEEYTLIVMLIRTSQAALLAGSLERVLAQGEPSDAALLALQQLLEREEAETPAVAVAALRGERALTHRMLEAVERGDLSLAGGLTPGPHALADRVGDFISSGMVRHSHAAYLRLLMKGVELAKLPCPEQIDRAKELDAVPIDQRAALARLLVPAVGKVLATLPRKLAQLRAARTALTLERYRRTHTGWPDSLEALVPGQLAAVPQDPYDGGPLHYRRLDDGVVIYSIGPDRKDNGGTLNRQQPLGVGSDLGFRLWDVAHRRRPARPRSPEPPAESPVDKDK